MSFVHLFTIQAQSSIIWGSVPRMFADLAAKHQISSVLMTVWIQALACPSCRIRVTACTTRIQTTPYSECAGDVRGGSRPRCVLLRAAVYDAKTSRPTGDVLFFAMPWLGTMQSSSAPGRGGIRLLPRPALQCCQLSPAGISMMTVSRWSV